MKKQAMRAALSLVIVGAFCAVAILLLNYGRGNNGGQINSASTRSEVLSNREEAIRKADQQGYYHYVVAGNGAMPTVGESK